MERSDIACQHWQSRREEGGAESKFHQKDTDQKTVGSRGGGFLNNWECEIWNLELGRAGAEGRMVGAHRRGARLFFRGAHAPSRVGVGDPPTPFCCGKTRAIALRAKGPSRMCGAGLATVAERRSRTAAASRPYRFFAFSAGRRKPHPGRARSPERENPWDPWVNCFSELTTNFTKKTRIRK